MLMSQKVTMQTSIFKEGQVDYTQILAAKRLILTKTRKIKQKKEIKGCLHICHNQTLRCQQKSLTVYVPISLNAGWQSGIVIISLSVCLSECLLVPWLIQLIVGFLEQTPDFMFESETSWKGHMYIKVIGQVHCKTVHGYVVFPIATAKEWNMMN